MEQKTKRSPLQEPEWDQYVFCDAIKLFAKDVGGSDDYWCWRSCMYHRGVLFGYYNHAWFVWVSNDPNATCIPPRCTDAGEYTSSTPILSGDAQWMVSSDVDDGDCLKEIETRLSEGIEIAKKLMEQLDAQRRAEAGNKKRTMMAKWKNSIQADQ